MCIADYEFPSVRYDNDDDEQIKLERTAFKFGDSQGGRNNKRKKETEIFG